jgi:hypothetical protein
MYPDILVDKQSDLLPLIKQFSKEYYLAGGTAIALQIGHRRSIDFDLFTSGKLKRRSIQNTLLSSGFPPEKLLYEAYDQLHVIVNGTKITFFSYPFSIPKAGYFRDIIQLPSLLDLAAMKAFALGGRGKWKDYVDLYFLLNKHFTIHQVENRAKALFGPLFNEKLFREQLSYFDDIDYSEVVEFVGSAVSMDSVKKVLVQKAVEKFSD